VTRRALAVVGLGLTGLLLAACGPAANEPATDLAPAAKAVAGGGGDGATASPKSSASPSTSKAEDVDGSYVPQVAPDTISTSGSQPSVHFSIKTKKPVFFITVDDGARKQQAAIDYVRSIKLPVTTFLYNGVVDGNYSYFKKFSAYDAVQNHTMDHKALSKQSTDVQYEICEAQRIYQEVRRAAVDPASAVRRGHVQLQHLGAAQPHPQRRRLLRHQAHRDVERRGRRRRLGLLRQQHQDPPRRHRAAALRGRPRLEPQEGRAAGQGLRPDPRLVVGLPGQVTLRSTAPGGARRAAVLVVALSGFSLVAGCAATTGPGDGATVAAAAAAAAAAAPAPASPGRSAGAPSPSPTGAAGAGQGPLTPPAPSSVDPPSGSDGMPAVVERIETDDPVVFLTIDDGWTADPDLPALLRRYGAHVTVFATDDAIAGKTGYLRDVVEAGATVQNHTLSHPDLRTVSSAAATEQICGASDRYAERFGTRPWLLRPPYGAYDDAALRAAAGCGIDYVVLWT
jgi:peptidoglycan/xylan/chitin deacetylase (PgdA/CDA1 family)